MDIWYLLADSTVAYLDQAKNSGSAWWASLLVQEVFLRELGVNVKVDAVGSTGYAQKAEAFIRKKSSF